MGCDWPKDASVCSLSISIHAPQWGATRDFFQLTSIAIYFNPRTPVGCDPYPWGIVPWISHFNPRTPVGCDCCIATHMGLAYVFQSTHPSGVRPTLCGVLAGLVDFNPRTPVGCDSAGLERTTRPPEFQSTHPSGVRPNTMAQKMRRLIFQSTHPSGVRLHASGRPHRRELISIHAPQWGATFDVHRFRQHTKFQSTHPSGVRPPACSCSRRSGYFNPRTPVGCDRGFA